MLIFSRKYDHLYKDDPQVPSIQKELEVLTEVGDSVITSESETDNEASTSASVSDSVPPKRDFFTGVQSAEPRTSRITHRRKLSKRQRKRQKRKVSQQYKKYGSINPVGRRMRGKLQGQ